MVVIITLFAMYRRRESLCTLLFFHLVKFHPAQLFVTVFSLLLVLRPVTHIVNHFNLFYPMHTKPAKLNLSFSLRSSLEVSSLKIQALTSKELFRSSLKEEWAFNKLKAECNIPIPDKLDL